MDRLEQVAKNGVFDKLSAALPYSSEIAGYNLYKVIEEYRDKAILGNVDIDKSWDDYVNKWRSFGGDKAIQFWTDWYNKDGKDLIK